MSQRLRKPRRSTPKIGRKRGRDFEEAVRDIFKNLFPNASITSGVWVVGPDGRRELDIEIVDAVDGEVLRGMIECKDYDPVKTGPVGIEYVDALDSKRRDLNLDFVILCSNAGFTETAIRKARRLDIGLLAAVRLGDQRVRFRVMQEVYVRHIRVKSLSLQVEPAPGERLPPEGTWTADQATLGGRQVIRWFIVRMNLMLASNPIVRGTFIDACRLNSPLSIAFGPEEVLVSQIACKFDLEGAWFAQTVELDATEGVYDWLRRRLRLTPKPDSRHLRIAGLDAYAGKWVVRPENVEQWCAALLPHEMDIKWLVMLGQPASDDPPDLSKSVWQEDLQLKLADPSPFTDSTPGFAIDPSGRPTGMAPEAVQDWIIGPPRRSTVTASARGPLSGKTGPQNAN